MTAAIQPAYDTTIGATADGTATLKAYDSFTRVAVVDAVGAAAGALLGGFLFGSSGPKIEGPRLGDLDVSSSTYGGVIPLGFGVQKIAGAMIWATDIDEDKNTRKEGGSLFGGGQKIVEYRYFANFAVAFGEGRPAGSCGSGPATG
jgi:hypothetical protein